MLQLNAFFNRIIRAGCLQADTAGSNNPQSCTDDYWQKTSFMLSMRHLELQPTSFPGGSPHQAPANTRRICSLWLLLDTALLWLLLPVKWALRQLSCSQGLHTEYPVRYKEVQMVLPQNPCMTSDKPGCSSSPFSRAGMMPSAPDHDIESICKQLLSLHWLQGKFKLFVCVLSVGASAEGINPAWLLPVFIVQFSHLLKVWKKSFHVLLRK